MKILVFVVCIFLTLIGFSQGGRKLISLHSGVEAVFVNQFFPFLILGQCYRCQPQWFILDLLGDSIENPIAFANFH